jgi:polyphosphate:AMP phosphotransferase
MTDSTQIASLREALLDAQFELRKQPNRGVLVIVTGLPSAGRSETVNDLHGWLNPKYVDVRAFDEGDCSVRERPPMWQYWQELPRRGRIAFFFDAWYGPYFDLQLSSSAKPDDLKRMVRRIRKTEEAIARNGISVLKVHLEVGGELQKLRIARLRREKLTRWRVRDRDLWQAKHHKKVTRAMHKCLRATDQPVAQWHVVNGTDPERRLLDVGQLLIAQVKAAAEETPKQAPEAWPKQKAHTKTAFPTKPRKPGHDDYDRELERLLGRFALLARRKRFQKHGLVLAFEGIDAAGKGGAIARLTNALDTRQYRVVPISAPTPEELSYPYLWRFWKPAPARGEITIFDRSWYGRVLVERVRGLTPETQWQRAYDEIREFEWQLADAKLRVLKFWLSLSFEEQLKRFKERDSNPLKRYKVDPEDWVNRRYFGEYQLAAKQMIARTDTPHAPWIVVEADDKHYARLKVLNAVCDALEQ